MTTPDVNVVVINFPNYEKELVVPNEDGSYTVMINARMSAEQQTKSYEHAMEHIRQLDFEKTNVQKIEIQAHHLPQRNTIATIEVRTERKHRPPQRTAQQKEQAAKMAFIERHILPHNPDYFFEQAEQNWLYGGL